MVFAEQAPRLGVGIGFRTEFYEMLAIDPPPPEVEWIEVVAEQFMPLNRARAALLDRLSSRYPIVFHSVSLSLGSLAPPEDRFLADYSVLIDRYRPPWISDHLAFTRLPQSALPSFFPVYRDEAAIIRISDRIKSLQDTFRVPFALENIAALIDVNSPIEEAEFITHVAERADCGLLLDLANLQARCYALGVSPDGYINTLDSGRVLQVHLAGNRWENGFLYDTHSEEVSLETWCLLAQLLALTTPCGILLERDASFPDDTRDLLDELAYADSLAHGRSQPPMNASCRCEPVGRLPRVTVQGQERLEAELSAIIASGEALNPNIAAMPPAANSGGSRELLRHYVSATISKRLEAVASRFPATTIYASWSGISKHTLSRALGRYTASPRYEGTQGTLLEATHFAQCIRNMARRVNDDVLMSLVELEYSRIGLALADGRDDDSAGGSTEHSGVRLSPRAVLLKAPCDIWTLFRAVQRGDRALSEQVSRERQETYLALVYTERHSLDVLKMSSATYRELRALLRGGCTAVPTAASRRLAEIAVAYGICERGAHGDSP